MELGAVLDLVDPVCELLVIMGDLNACTAVLAPTREGQVPHVGIDTMLYACGHSFLLPTDTARAAAAKQHNIAVLPSHLP